jgi:hypothetical protein
VVVGTAIMTLNLPSPPTVVDPTAGIAVPAQVMVTVEPAAKLLPLMVVAASPLLGVRVMAAGAGGAVRAVRFRLVTPPACQAAVCVAA